MAKKPVKKTTTKKNTKKPYSFEEVELPPIEMDDETIDMLVVEMEKLLEWHEVRNLNYSNEWYRCSYDVKRIIEIQQLKHFEAIENINKIMEIRKIEWYLRNWVSFIVWLIVALMYYTL